MHFLYLSEVGGHVTSNVSLGRMKVEGRVTALKETKINCWIVKSKVIISSEKKEEANLPSPA